MRISDWSADVCSSDLNITIRHHISGRDPSHQKKTLQLPSGTELLILLTDFLGHNVMKTFRAAAQRAGIRVLACRRSVCSMKQALNQCGYCEACDVKLAASEPKAKFAVDGRAGRPRVRAA